MTFDPISLDVHRDFPASVGFDLFDWLVRSYEAKAPGRNEALLLTPDADPVRMTTHELAAHLRENGMSSQARRVERALVPVGHALAFIVGDEMRMRVLRVDDLVATSAEPATVTAVGVLGMLAGGQR